ncbi:MAG: family 10 glycosylhydrolase [Anaerolineae bacterium]
MKRWWRPLAYLCLALCILCSPISPGWLPLQGAEETRAGDWHQTTLADFAKGNLENLQLLDYGDGALSLTIDGQTDPRGVYTSVVNSADFDFNAVGIQWHARLPPETSLLVFARVSADGIAWSPWQEVVEPGQDGEHFFALAPLVVETSRYIQYRLLLASQQPNLTPRLEDITLTYIDSSRGPSLQEVEGLTLEVQPEAGTVPQPAIVSRSDWGANESYRFDGQGNEIWPTEYQIPTKVIIHHSVTMNNDPTPPATVRAIYYYHAVTLGWGDVGYNYLVDWHGNIYEGRYGGKDVVGGHAYGYNYGSVGVCAMGTYGNTSNSVPPHAELLAGLADLSAWQCSRTLVNPNESSFFVDRATENMAGHRDYNATACPGDYLYAELPSLRTEVWNQILTYTPTYFADYLSHDAPQVMLSTQSGTLSLSVRNRGTLTWLAEGTAGVALGYRWRDEQSGVIPGHSETPLPHDVSYGHLVEIHDVAIQAPAQPGQYLLELDLLHRGVGWFSEQGSPTLTVPVTVVDPNTSHHAYFPLALLDQSPPVPTPTVEARALWVPRWSYSSEADVKAIVDKAGQANFNIIFFQVRGQADAYYQSQYEPWADRLSGTLGQDPGWDPLATAIEEAHAAGLELHAYVNVYTVWLGTTPPPGDTIPQHMYHRFNDLYGNEWVQWHQNGTPMELNSSYLTASPGHPAVSEHIIAACRDILQNYDVDGLHLDYIRYSSPYYSHDPVSEQRFQAVQPVEWADWQRAQITEVVSRLYDEVMQLRPDASVSVAAWPVYQDKWGWVSYGGIKYDGYDGYYQDSRGWLQLGKMDALAPMLYGAAVQDHLDRFQILTQDFVNESHGRHIYAGIHAGYDSFSEIQTRIDIARQAGAQGQAIFAYSLIESNDYWDEFRTGPYAEPATVPPMPWKAQPTPTPTPTPDAELIINGGFESEAGWQTPITSHPAGYSTTRAHSGARSVRTGIEDSQDNVYSYSSAWQAVSIPSNTVAANLHFWEYPMSQETEAWEMEGPMAFSGDPRLLQVTDDTQYLLILDEQGDWLDTVLWRRSNARTWLEHTHDLIQYAGQTIRLHFGTLNDGQDGVTAMYVDDVSLQVTY